MTVHIDKDEDRVGPWLIFSWLFSRSWTSPMSGCRPPPSPLLLPPLMTSLLNREPATFLDGWGNTFPEM